MIEALAITFPAALIIGFLLSLGVKYSVYDEVLDRYIEEKFALIDRITDLEIALHRIREETCEVIGYDEDEEDD